MVEEVGLDEEKLAELLEKGFSSKHKKIFNQLLLADDFLRFKTLMVNRNKALEAEAIKALEKSHVEPKREKPVERKEERDVLRESKLAEEARRRQEEEEEEQLRKVLEMSRLEAEEKEAIKRLEEKAAES